MAVAAKISTRLAEVKVTRTKAKMAVKRTVSPTRRFVFGRMLSTKIVTTGRVDARTVAIMLLALLIFALEYDVSPVSSSNILPAFRRLPNSQ